MKCQNCGNEFEGNFCSSCGFSVPAAEIPAVQSGNETASNKNSMQLVIVILLVVNIIIAGCLGVINLSKSSNSVRNVDAMLQEQKLMQDYRRELGNNVSIVSDSISKPKESYGSAKLVGVAKNNSNDIYTNVNIEVDFYKGDTYVATNSCYLSKMPPNAELEFDMYCPDVKFDTYRLAFIEANLG